MSYKEEVLKWVLTKWHFWTILIVYTLFSWIREYHDAGFYGAVFLGIFLGSFVFIYLLYLIGRSVVYQKGKNPKLIKSAWSS